MKITKKLLNENHIFNPHGIASTTNERLFISFSPAERGRITRFAKWQVVGIKIVTDPKAAWYDNHCMTFNAYCKEEKEPQLQKAKDWVKERYGLNITERDVWGDWHVTGTMDKLKTILSTKETTDATT